MEQQEFPKTLVLRYPPADVDWHDFSSLFGKLTVLKILWGFECPTAKQEISEINRYMACFKKMNVAMVAVCEESQGSKEFMESGVWCGELYIDPYRDLCKSEPNKRFFSKRILDPFRKKIPKQRSLFQRGGTYIITADCQVVFKHEPEPSPETPSMGLMLFTCYSLTAFAPKLLEPSNPSAPRRRSWMKYIHPSENIEDSAKRQRRQSMLVARKPGSPADALRKRASIAIPTQAKSICKQE
ncbi:hypothetical protein DSO57_1003896 [Entomophthora muscae]|uniref:Uncharacterized protein n=1 Tax=Entomophthora muscae TaxID=34485 RepID=A0ACC2SAH4_9FUNG|nr:hypothetical protein DSO57_1003896 [Entomophthora muscae]